MHEPEHKHKLAQLTTDHHRTFHLLGWAITHTNAVKRLIPAALSLDWPAWILSPLQLIGFRGAISATHEGGIVRAALWLLSSHVVDVEAD